MKSSKPAEHSIRYPRLCAALIAGGKSRRMGLDKGRIDCEGHPLWRRQWEKLHALQARETVISGGSEGGWTDEGLPSISDQQQDAGPLAGIARVLEVTRCELVLALAVDLPEMTAAYLRCLVERCGNGQGAVPVIRQRFEPLAAVYPAACRELVATQLAAGEYSIQKFLTKAIAAGLLRPIDVAEADEKHFRNLNHPGDVMAWREGVPAWGERSFLASAVSKDGSHLPRFHFDQDRTAFLKPQPAVLN